MNKHYDIKTEDLHSIIRLAIEISGDNGFLGYKETFAINDFVARHSDIDSRKVEKIINTKAKNVFPDVGDAITAIYQFDQERKQFASDLIAEAIIVEEKSEEQIDGYSVAIKEGLLPMPQISAEDTEPSEAYKELRDNSVMDTYIVISYYERDERKIPGDYRNYTPCTIHFVQKTLDEVKEFIGVDTLSYYTETPDLDKITESLDLSSSRMIVSGMKLVIFFDKNGQHGYNKLFNVDGLAGNSLRQFLETGVVCFYANDKFLGNVTSGFRSKKLIRQTLKAFDKSVYGLAYNGPVYDQPEVKKRIEKAFWQDIEDKLDDLELQMGSTSRECRISDAKNKEKRSKAIESLNNKLRAKLNNNIDMSVQEVDKKCTFKDSTLESMIIDDEYLLMINTNFNIQGCQGEKCACCAYFYHYDATIMTTDNDNYSTASSNQMICTYEFTPKYNNSDFSDIQISIPTQVLYESVRASNKTAQPFWIKLRIFNFAIDDFIDAGDEWVKLYLHDV
jgi:hypothetical protein